jgi:signal transduction histidine kinase
MDSRLNSIDAPLPVSISGSGHSWFTRYRRYPVFSAPWARGRVQVVGGCAAVGLLLALVSLWGFPLAELPFGGIAQLAVQVLVPVLAGPWLGVAVRRCQWPEVHEGLALAGAMVAVVVAMLAFHEIGATPLKQWIAERTGQVDKDGKRKRMVMMIGMTVTSQDAPASAPPGAPGGRDADSPVTQLINSATSAAITFFLAGGAGLWGWRRERAGLSALAREQELAQAQAQRREAELRLSVLAAQVEPHFLFNTLAGVRSAIATDPPRASEMIDRLVDYLRAAIPRLRSDGGAQATLGGQLDIVRAYLGLMAARMPRLQFDIDVPVELLSAPFPPLMLISLAENAVKHGVEPKIGPVRVTVQARRTDDGMLEVTVADDGAGFGVSAGGSGLGLTNIRERLQQMYPGRAELTLRARPEGGVAATLNVPLE